MIATCNWRRLPVFALSGARVLSPGAIDTATDVPAPSLERFLDGKLRLMALAAQHRARLAAS